MSQSKPIEEQIAILMQGVEMGDEKLKEAMQAELKEKLIHSAENGEPIRVYCGYDPTSPDLHLARCDHPTVEQPPIFDGSQTLATRVADLGDPRHLVAYGRPADIPGIGTLPDVVDPR